MMDNLLWTESSKTIVIEIQLERLVAIAHLQMSQILQRMTTDNLEFEIVKIVYNSRLCRFLCFIMGLAVIDD